MPRPAENKCEEYVEGILWLLSEMMAPKLAGRFRVGLKKSTD